VSANLTLLSSGFGLLEAGRWHPEQGLLFSDMTLGGVYQLPEGDVAPRLLVPHRKGVGGLVPHADGGLVISGRNIAHKVTGATITIQETAPDEQFFNDITADGRGRLFVGSVARRATDATAEAPGRLYQIDPDGSSVVLAEDVLISNGLAADPTDSRLYHVDSGRRVIWRFALHDDRPADDREALIDTREYDGVPDGLAVASDGSLWVAMAGAGLVVGWDPDGRRIAELPVPSPLVTSVCFGGADLASLYILTGVNDEHHHPLGGLIYRTHAPRVGLPSPQARTRVPASA
jgi:gluconolactonase